MTESENLRQKLRERTRQLNEAQREASLLQSCLQEVFIERTPPMEPRPVVRDEHGFYHHPLYPLFPEAVTPSLFQLWLEHQGLECQQSALSCNAAANDDCACLEKWEPDTPEGEGWFLGVIGDTEEGALAVWLRHTDEGKRARDLQLMDYFAKAGTPAWGSHREHFGYDSLHEVILAHELKAGAVVYHGEVSIPAIESFVDSDSVMEDMTCAAEDIAGEAASDFPDASDDDKQALDRLLKDWVQSIGHPMWYGVTNIKPYTVTQADIDAASLQASCQ